MNHLKKSILSSFLFLSIVFVFPNIIFANNTSIVSATVNLAVCGNGAKDYGEQCDTNDLNSKTCSNLGYDGGALSCSPSCEFDTTACTTNASTMASTILSPSADRTYILPDGSDSLNIDLPASFYSTDLSLFLFSHPVATNAPTDSSLIGKVFNLVFINENGDIVHQTQRTSTITLSYSNLDLNTVDESTLAPYRSEDDGVTWNPIHNFTLDTNAKNVTFTTSDFSFFSIFGFPHSQNNNNNNGGGGTYGSGSGGTYSPPKATPEEKKKIIKVADFNGDGHVDLSDLSILLYHYEHTDAVAGKYDLNNDGKVDIIDVSIMLYYWEVTS